MDTPGLRCEVTVPGGPPAADVLGIWVQAPAEAVPDEWGAPVPATSHWRVDLAADPRLASRGLRSHLALIDRVGPVLPVAERRLWDFAQQIDRPGAASFDLGTTPLPPAEQELWSLTMAMRGQVAQSFYPGEDLVNRWQGYIKEAGDFIDQARRALSMFVVIDTTLAGRELGRTRIGWLGDVQTGWYRAAPADHVSLHGDAVTLALATRNMWLLIASRITGSAVRLGGALLAGSPILAAPAAWRFIKQIVEEVRTLRATLHAPPPA
jgi:hypothetical protein